MPTLAQHLKIGVIHGEAMKIIERHEFFFSEKKNEFLRIQVINLINGLYINII